MLKNQNADTIHEAINLLEEMSGNKAMRYAAFKREIALHDETTFINEARRQGIAIGEANGEARGIDKATKAIALNLRALNIRYEDISRSTGLSIDEIKALESSSSVTE